MTTNTTQFDPWDWLGIHCGGYFADVEVGAIEMLKSIRDGKNPKVEFHGRGNKLFLSLLCNTDAFEFDTDPTQLRWVGDDRFETLDQLIDAWDAWYRDRYS